MSRAILAIDPGKTTGVVELRVPIDGPVEIARAYEIPGEPLRVGEAVEDWDDLYEPSSVVVMEDWEYRHGVPTDAKDACIPMGVILYVAARHQVPVILQRPSFRMGVPDNLPKNLTLPKLKPHDDYGQALKHGLAYIMYVMNHIPTLEHLRPRT